MSSFNQYNGDGSTTNFNITFPYLDRDHVEVSVGWVPTLFTFVSDSVVRIYPAPAIGTGNVIINRNTSKTPIVDFNNGSTLTESDLDTATLQAIYIAEESVSAIEGVMKKTRSNTAWEGQSLRLGNIANPANPQDAATKAYVDAISGFDISIAAKRAAMKAERAAMKAMQAEQAASLNVMELQGDIITEGASGPKRLGTGTAGQVLTSNGASSDITWADPVGGLLNVQIFTESGTYNPTTGTKKQLVEMVGGGGSGAGGSGNNGGLHYGAGGGAGGYAKAFFATAVGSTSVNVGEGGAGVINAPGRGGSASAFGTHIICGGGGGGLLNNNRGGEGGIVVISTGVPLAWVSYRGYAGSYYFSGNGATTPLGDGGKGHFAGDGAVHFSATGFGAGGAGANNKLRTGGGAPGKVIVYEYS